MWKKIFLSTRQKKLAPRSLNNQNGQIAIFIALIFQVLFIFFAMLINVGLIVHDKINLQNSVDFAAYYGAERQAELLNKIAHINYQIRQEYKLLAWRQRILGTYTFNANSYLLQNPPALDELDKTMPAVCIDHAGWTEIYVDGRPEQTDNCKSPFQYKPPVPKYAVIASFMSLQGNLAKFYDSVAQTATKECAAMGPLNWSTASLWLLEYKQSVQKRSDLIRQIAANLSTPGRSFVDLHGLPVSIGVQKTFLKNLTEANRVSVATKSADSVDTSSDFTFINSLSSDVPGGCQIETGGDPAWLHENQISPKLTYLTSISKKSDCTTSVELVESPPLGIMASPLFQAIGPALLAIDSTEPPPTIHTGPYSSLGFEKNPWCMAYVGVKARTRPRKPFAPFGKPVTLVARAFAAPFGGRIGPWNKSTWSPGADRSSGETLDNLAVPLTEDNNVTPKPLVPPVQASDLVHSPIPNYSRYPGDQLGLASRLVKYLFGMRSLFTNLPNSQMSKSKTFPLESYNHFANPNNTDALAQSTSKAPPNSSALRGLELAAVAPDLFDITYYSIDADYYAMYFSPGDPIGDIGTSLPDKPNSNVNSQMIEARRVLFGPDLTPSINGINWLTPNLDFLLTGWIQGRTGEYPISPAQFATCAVHPQYAKGYPPTPGFCVVGGRTGYSVRILARKYLQSSKLELGGQGIVGGLKNSLPSGW